MYNSPSFPLGNMYDKLNADIMNIPMRDEIKYWDTELRTAYALGHRDARHAAVESILEHKPCLTIYSCDSHDHVVVKVDDDEVISNDYSVENIRRLADYFGWNIIDVVLNSGEFEEKFA